MSNYAKVNNQCVNDDIQMLCGNNPASTVAFLRHTNANGNAPAYATEQDELVFNQVKSASMEFKSVVGGNVANTSVIAVSDLSVLSTLSPASALTAIPCTNASSISYVTTCGVFALSITNAVATGSSGNLTLNNFLQIFANAEYELIIGYWNDVLESNIAIGFDMTGIAIPDGYALAYEFVKDQEVLTALNGKYVLQGNGTVKIIGVNQVTKNISGVDTIVYQISVQA